MQSSKKTKLVVSILFLLSLLNSHSVAETELDGLEKLKPYKLPPIEKSQAHYLTPENTLSASRSSLLSKDLKWHQQAFTQEALVYINQLYAAAEIDPATVFQLTDANDEEYLLEIIPYKDGILVVVETHYNDTDGRILTTAGVLVQENGLWKITFDYHEDDELEQYESIRYTNCIASYTFYPDAKDDMCFHSNDLTIKSNVLDTFDLRNGKNQATLIFNGVDSVLGREQLNDLSNTNISLGGWIKAQPADHDMTIIEIGSPADNSIAITLPTGSGVRYRASVGGHILERVVGVDNDFHDNNWHHLYLTFDGNTMKFYIDGEEKDSQPISGTIDAQPVLNIGQSNGVQGNPSNHFKGMIDDIQIFNIALTKEQVLEKMTPDYR